jgi:general secretion pathway protein G
MPTGDARLQSPRGERGFTLIELLIVIAIIGIIAGIAVAQLRTTPQRAREAVLKEDLYAIRDVIDQYFADKGKYPESLDALGEEGYLRRIPDDHRVGRDLADRAGRGDRRGHGD